MEFCGREGGRFWEGEGIGVSAGPRGNEGVKGDGACKGNGLTCFR